MDPDTLTVSHCADVDVDDYQEGDNL